MTLIEIIVVMVCILILSSLLLAGISSRRLVPMPGVDRSYQAVFQWQTME